MADKNKENNSTIEYRNFLVTNDQKSQESFDKTVLWLSGGALAISFAFVKDIIGTKPVVCPLFLIAAWVTWALSTCAVLISHHLSHRAFCRAIDQVDEGKIDEQRPGGRWSVATELVNIIGAILFFIGVCCMILFVYFNLPH